MSVEIRNFTATSPATATTAVATTLLERLDQFEDAMVVATLTGATGGALDVYLQAWDGTDWVDYLHFAQVASGASAATFACPITRKSQRTAPVAVGKNGSPALAAATCIGGDFGDRMRVVFVAGSGTSAGAAQTIRVVGTRLTS